jgi:aminoglycoside phosphotransferase family enzyme
MEREWLPSHIEVLLSPSICPHCVDHVELVQTHISYVILAWEYVGELKKPVELGFLDYTTLARRWLYCEEEVRSRETNV